MAEKIILILRAEGNTWTIPKEGINLCEEQEMVYMSIEKINFPNKSKDYECLENKR